MDYKIQLLSFLLSFLFGIFFSFVSQFHYDLVFSLKKFMRYLLTFLFILDISLGYILMMYYINDGVIHLYFVGVTLLGYGCEKYFTNYVKKYVKRMPIIAKYFRK